MRVIAIEEHCQTQAVSDANSKGKARPTTGPVAERMRRLDDFGPLRLAEMDAGGIDLQVLSQMSPATDALEGSLAIEVAREANDRMAAAVAEHPDRLSAFAALPTSEPKAAADELERAVKSLGFKGAMINGLPGGNFMEGRAYWPIFEQAQALGVPVYLHPAEPPAAVRQAYFDGFDPAVSQLLATGGWGWHIETGLHSLRLILGGVFDQFPDLRIIIGHMGEALPFMIARADTRLNPVSGLKRPLKDYFHENFYITTSGFFTYPPLLCALMVVGADRIMFSVDYPFSTNDVGRAFLDSAPISPEDREKIAHRNAEELMGL